jgi:hypothetical protein
VFILLSIVGVLNVGVLECWSVGVLECWSVGVLECWSVGVLMMLLSLLQSFYYLGVYLKVGLAFNGKEWGSISGARELIEVVFLGEVSRALYKYAIRIARAGACYFYLVQDSLQGSGTDIGHSYCFGRGVVDLSFHDDRIELGERDKPSLITAKTNLM